MAPRQTSAGAAARLAVGSAGGASRWSVPRSLALTRREAAILGAVMGVGFAVYATLALLASVPRIFPDELVYVDSASSLLHGDGLSVRGGSYGYGGFYPSVVVAPILWAAPDRETAYEVLKVLNAIFFALAAVPVYLLARRLLSSGWALAVSALALAIPASVYVSVVMTESVSFLLACSALFAMLLVLERATLARQLAALALVVMAYSARPQLVALAISYVLALALLPLVRGRRAEPLRATARRLWPTLAALGAALVAFLLVPLVRGRSPAGELGSYSDLWRSYDLASVAKWFVHSLGDFELYLAVLPIAVCPIVLVSMLRRARAGSDRDAAFLTLFVVSSVVFLLEVAAFSSTARGGGFLHDRYLFYLAPLWLVVFGYWLRDGMPRPLLAALIGAAVALALPLVLPAGYAAAGTNRFDAVATALWAKVREEAGGIQGLDLRRLLAVFTIVLLGAAFAVPRRWAALLPLCLVAVFGVTAGFAWHDAIAAPERAALAGGSGGVRDWVDRRVPAGASVTGLHLASPRCNPILARDSFYMTEFFNSSVRKVAFIEGSDGDALNDERVRLRPDGTLALASGERLRAPYVLTLPGVELRGRRLARGTAAHLVLWQAQTPDRVLGGSSGRRC